MDPEWLKRELSQPGRSQSALARFMGLVPEQVNRICKGTRQIKASEAEQIHNYLESTVSGGAAITPLSTRRIIVSGIPLRGTVEAGSWREVPLTDMELEYFPAPKSLVDAGAYGLRVAGPSMNLRYPEGTIVIVLPWHGGPLPFGRRVIVERVRADGLVETTIKEMVKAADGSPELWPRSSHPAHQKPIPLDTADGITVRLIGVVKSSYIPEE